MLRKPKTILFNEEMERDIDDIKCSFTQKFRITPSNTEIMKLLLKTYKESNLSISRKPRNKNKFEVMF